MKITSQKLKVTPLIFKENYKNNVSKMFFSQKQEGGGVDVELAWQHYQMQQLKKSQK